MTALPAQTFPEAPDGYFFALATDPHDQRPEVRLYRARKVFGLFNSPVLIVRQGVEVHKHLASQDEQVNEAARSCLRAHQATIRDAYRYIYLRKQAEQTLRGKNR